LSFAYPEFREAIYKDMMEGPDPKATEEADKEWADNLAARAADAKEKFEAGYYDDAIDFNPGR
jgi:hypothetical protein